MIIVRHGNRILYKGNDIIKAVDIANKINPDFKVKFFDMEE